MTELHGLKLLLDIPEGDATKDGLLELLLGQAREYIISYCRCEYINEGMIPLIIRMAAEDYGKCGGEGISFRSASGASESYRGEYSPQIMCQLRRYRKPGGIVC